MIIQQKYSGDALKYGNRVIITTALLNVALAIGKLAAGIFGHSAAMVSDAAHSACDLLISLFVMLGLHISHKKADTSHPYGHERLESLVSVIMAGVLATVAFGIGKSAVYGLLHYQQLSSPGLVALLGALLCIAVKEWMYRYSLAAGRRIGSLALEADAWHHRTDALSSVGSLLGIGGAMLGWRILDPLAALLICLMILRTSLLLLKNAINQLIDSAAPPEVIEQMQALIAAEPDIIRVDDLKTRQHGCRLYVDVEISVSHLLSLIHAHDIAERLHEKIESANPMVKHCMVHVNPCEIQND